MLVRKRSAALAIMVCAVLAGGGAALAALGQPSPWQFGLQQSATPVMDNIIWFHDFLLYIITAIVSFVLVLLLVVMVRFNARSHPIPSRTTHNTLLEVAWTTIPIVILLVIAVPSFKLLFFELIPPPAELTVKATGKQWYWTYSYPDNGGFEFDSNLVKDEDLKQDQPRLLTADTRDGGAGQQERARAHDGRRRDPFFRGAVVRDQDQLHPRSDQRDLVQGHA